MYPILFRLLEIVFFMGGPALIWFFFILGQSLKLNYIAYSNVIFPVVKEPMTSTTINVFRVFKNFSGFKKNPLFLSSTTYPKKIQYPKSLTITLDSDEFQARYQVYSYFQPRERDFALRQLTRLTRLNQHFKELNVW